MVSHLTQLAPCAYSYNLNMPDLQDIRQHRLPLLNLSLLSRELVTDTYTIDTVLVHSYDFGTGIGMLHRMQKKRCDKQSEKAVVAELESLYAIDPLVVRVEEGDTCTAPDHSLLKTHHDATIARQIEILTARHERVRGYQCNTLLDYARFFAPLLDVHVNNAGCPYIEGSLRTSTKAAERAVVRYFSRLWRTPTPTRASPRPTELSVPLAVTASQQTDEFFHDAFGYVLTLGCTEGNLYALRTARDYLKGKFLVAELNGRAGEIAEPHTTDPAKPQARSSLMPAPTAVHTVPAAHAVPGLLNTGDVASPQYTCSHPDLMRPQASITERSGDMHSTDDPTTSTTSANSPHPVNQPAASSVMTPSASAGSACHLPPLKMVRAVRTPGATRSATTVHKHHVHHSHPPRQGSDSHEDTEMSDPRVQRRLRERLIEAEAAMEARRAHQHANASPHSSVDTGQVWVRHEPVLLYGASAHYSIDKIRDLLELYTPETLGSTHYPGQCPLTQHLSGALRGAWPAKVPAHVDGRVQVNALVALAHFFTSRGHPIIICVTYGTTFTAAHEDPVRIYRALRDAGCLHEDTYEYTVPRASVTAAAAGSVLVLRYERIRRNFWIHVDGALGGWYGGYFGNADPVRRAATARLLGVAENTLPRLPSFDFKAGAEVGPARNTDDRAAECGPVMSIAVSGHKQCGAPFPTGVVLTLRRYMLDYRTVAYDAPEDSTLGGSRNGLAALLLWSQLARHTDMYHASTYMRQSHLARVFATTLAHALGCRVNEYGGLVFHAPHALAVIFPRPTRQLLEFNSLSSDVLRYPDFGEAWQGSAQHAAARFPSEDTCDGAVESAGDAQHGHRGTHVQAPDLVAAHVFVMPQWTETYVVEMVRALRRDAKVQTALRAYRVRVERAGGSLPPLYDEQGALLDVWGRVLEHGSGPLPPVTPLTIDEDDTHGAGTAVCKNSGNTMDTKKAYEEDYKGHRI